MSKRLLYKVDPQDPLPESNWFFRRVTLIGSIMVLFAHRSWEIYYNRPLDKWTDFLILALIIAYTVAPSAEQVSKMLATVALFRYSPREPVKPPPTAAPAPASPAPAPGTVSVTFPVPNLPPWKR